MFLPLLWVDGVANHSKLHTQIVALQVVPDNNFILYPKRKLNYDYQVKSNQKNGPYQNHIHQTISYVNDHIYYANFSEIDI